MIAYAILSKCLLFGSLTTVVYFRYQVFLSETKVRNILFPIVNTHRLSKHYLQGLCISHFHLKLTMPNVRLLFCLVVGKTLLHNSYKLTICSDQLVFFNNSVRIPPPFTYHNHKYLCKVHSELFIFFFNLGTFSPLFIRKKIAI